MHIPDGFLSVVLAAVFWVPSLIALSLALRHTGRQFSERLVPRMGVLAAAIFAAQMLNFSVIGGTSGHLLGASLATILLGPWAAVLVMACVVGVQALFFQDGGFLALGANLFNMAVVGVAVSYTVYRTVEKLSARRPWGILVGGFAAGWASIFMGSLAVGLQLALSGVSPANLVIPAMAGIHALIGVGEGLATGGALAFLAAVQSDLLRPTISSGGGADPGRVDRQPGWWIIGLVLALALAIASPLASSDPDGLQKVAEQQGFLERTAPPALRLFPDYLFPGMDDLALATILAGILGIGLVLGVVLLGAAFQRNGRITPDEHRARPPKHTG